uniref:Conserved plasma membrane protein n=1 Tax=Echinostoma caproni TaxID=27848 RepID=A0A183AE07_9TREM
LNETAYRLLQYLSDAQKASEVDHWCGEFFNCARKVYKGIDPTSTSVLYPKNRHYLFLVRKILPNLYGYHTYIPYKTFFSPIGVVILAALGTAIHYLHGKDLTDVSLGVTDYIYLFGSNIIISWHQFGLGLIMCSLAKSTRTVLFPLLALFACLVLTQLVCINNVLDNV